MKTVEEYKAEIKALRKTMKKAENTALNLFAEAHRMFEGKYAIGKQDNPYAGMNVRPFDYVYKNDEDREREEADKEKWLVENGYYENKKLDKECWETIKKLTAELCWAEHGMCEEEWYLVRDIEHAEKRVKNALALVEEEKAKVEEAKIKLAEYRANKEKN